MSGIRHFLQKKRKIESSPSSINESNHDIGNLSNLSTNSSNSSNSSQQKEVPQLRQQLTVGANKLDIGLYLNSYVDDELRLKLLKDPWVPPKTYDFKKDLTNDSTRVFRVEWFALYPWLSYSAVSKGPLCRVCVLFRPRVHRGVQGAFIVSPCIKYQKFNEVSKAHEISIWHKDAINASQHFLNSKERKQLSVHEQIDSAFNREIKENRVKLRSIISSILFCAKHDLPLRGKNDEGSVFTDLLQFRVESGDAVLNKHLKSGAKNALYISHEVQNELIKTCANVLRQNIIEEVKLSSVFSVLADETADISGTEQLSIGVRYLFYDVKFQKHKICEEFIGYSPLTKLDSKSIAKTIIEFLESCNLDLNRLVGQGYDGCATMAGHISGVQKLINEAYPMALYFHCASHVLNLVFNDLNNVSEVRNTTGIIKEIINFFRESTLRRKIIPNIPLLCETRWSAKYKSIRIFSDNFIVIVKALEELSKSTANAKTKIKSYQLFTAATTPVFIVTLQVIAVYSAKFEPVCNLLQQVNINLKTVNNHITKLVDILQLYRNDSSTEFTVLFEKSKEIAEELDVEIRPPRVAARQSQRSNHPSTNHEEFFRISIFVPYLDSVISSLKDRFSIYNSQPIIFSNGSSSLCYEKHE